ncbi:MAG: hypothetical protein AAF517_20635 [Planctomycetota bacterium]
MKAALVTARVLFGLPLFGFGLMGLIVVRPDPAAFLNQPDGFSPEGTKLMLALWESGFLMLSVCLAHIVSGGLVLVGRFVPLALVLHLPISVLMVLFHLVLDPRSGGGAYLILPLNLFLLYVHRASFRPLLTPK